MSVHSNQGISTLTTLFDKKDEMGSCFPRSKAPLSIIKSGTHTFTTVNEVRKKKEFLISSKFVGREEVCTAITKYIATTRITSAHNILFCLLVSIIMLEYITKLSGFDSFL